MVLTMNESDLPFESSLDIRPDDSDLGIKRQQLMFDGQLLDDDGYSIYGRLHSQKAGSPRMTLDDLHKQLWTWRCWRECNGDCRRVALKMRAFGWAGTTKEHVRYRIRRMAKQGMFHNLGKMPPIP